MKKIPASEIYQDKTLLDAYSDNKEEKTDLKLYLRQKKMSQKSEPLTLLVNFVLSLLAKAVNCNYFAFKTSYSEISSEAKTIPIHKRQRKYQK